MATLTLIAVGFLGTSAVAVALARGSTARWEQDKRAAAAFRDHIATRGTSSAGSALRIPGALIRRAGVGLRNQASRFRSWKAPAQLLPTGITQVTSRVRPIRRLVGVLRLPLVGGKVRGGRWTRSGSPARPVDGDAEGTAASRLGSKPAQAPSDARRHGVARTTGSLLSRSTVARARRRGLAFLHRPEEPQDARIPQDDRDESSAAH